MPRLGQALAATALATVVAAVVAAPSTALGQDELYPGRDRESSRRFLATSYLGVRIGGAWGFNTVSPGTPAAVGGGVFWMHDGRNFLAEIGADFYGIGGDRDYAAGISAYYPLLDQNLSPYLGGGLRFAWTRWGDGASIFGLQPHLAAGVVVGRLTTVLFRAELDWYFNAFSERYAGGDLHSHGPIITVGLAF